MKFTSVELQNAFNEAKPVLENITYTKNTISEEIKSLEKFLQEQAISDNFTLQIRYPSYPGSFEATEEGLFTNEVLLIWDAEKKRIIYQHNQYNASYIDDGDVSFNGDSVCVIIKRPLIETSFEVRKLVYELYLSKFLLGIKSKYELAKQSAEDCPF